MTDELLYERLAVSIARTGSPLPYLHGRLVPVVDQLYPLLIAPAYRHGLVPHDLERAHAINAWVMSSAAIPAFLLARRVTRTQWITYLVALLTVCLPWIVLSSFLLTEVVGYPAFLWAVLAIQAAIASPSRRNDVLALLGIGLAVVARTQFELLLIVLPVALLAVEVGRGTGMREAVRRHVVLAVAYAALVLGAVVLAALGSFSRVLGTYRGGARGAARPRRGRAVVPRAHGDAGARPGDPAVRRRGGVAAREHRPSAAIDEPYAFAAVTGDVAVVVLEGALFDLRFGEGTSSCVTAISSTPSRCSCSRSSARSQTRAGSAGRSRADRARGGRLRA